MRCVICGQGETRPGVTTLVLERDGVTTVVREVPAEICMVCGEDYVDEATAARLLDADSLGKTEAAVEIREFVPA